MSTVADLRPRATDDASPPTAALCPTCGAPVAGDDHFCPACGAGLAAAPPPAAQRVDQQHFRCQTCGAEVATDPLQRSYVCPFCDSAYVLEFSPEPGRQEPEFVIGFAVTPEQALEKFRAWIADNSWFRPGDLRLAKIEDKLRGVYLPFWTFSMLAQGEWAAEIGEHWYRTETYMTMENGKPVTRTRQVQETEWWELAGRHHRYYSGYLVSGSRGLKQADAERIKPFFLPAMKRYDPSYLAGWLAEDYSIDRNQALDVCQAEFSRRQQRDVAGFLPGDTQRNQRLHTEFSGVTSDLVLLPIYLLSYRHQDRVFRFLINGQTGRVDGDKPVSWPRVGGAVAAAVIAILILILMLRLLN
jgi:DNA-directed RNA polymerase subunit RPC12/RpoP